MSDVTILFNTLGIPDHARPLARLITDYDPSLSLERLPDRHPWLIDNPDKPYAVIHRSLQHGEYVFESYPESMLDERIFAAIVEGDARRHGFDMSKFDPVGMAAQMLGLRQREDAEEEKNDRAMFAAKQRTQ